MTCKGDDRPHEQLLRQYRKKAAAPKLWKNRQKDKKKKMGEQKMNGTNENKTVHSPIRENRSRLRVMRVLGVLVCVTAVLLLALTISGQNSEIKASGEAVAASSSTPDSSSSAESSSAAQTEISKQAAADSTPQEQTATQTQVTTKAAAKEASTEIAPKVEVKNGITYVGGILIANKTYSLPSDYDPGLDADAEAAFYTMQQAAAADGISLWICSGYRSYSYQKQLYDNYAAQDGKDEADRYSARPGHSEHQTGLAIDVNEPSSDFDNTPEAEWLAKHCNDYGFILRYKPGKESSTGYMAESWHIRYLGDAELCKKIEASGKSLEEYLGITSAYAQ